MKNLELLIQEGKVSRLPELEIDRYVNFFEQSYRDNFNHCISVRNTFPRWSIISGYYAMHDITKLLIAKHFGMKIEYEVHTTTIAVLREILKDKVIIRLIERGIVNLYLWRMI